MSVIGNKQMDAALWYGNIVDSLKKLPYGRVISRQVNPPLEIDAEHVSEKSDGRIFASITEENSTLKFKHS